MSVNKKDWDEMKNITIGEWATDDLYHLLRVYLHSSFLNHYYQDQEFDMDDSLRLLIELFGYHKDELFTEGEEYKRTGFSVSR